MLIHRKSSTDDEYHHVDLLGNFWVVIGANGGVLWSNLQDTFVNAQYVANNVRIAQPVVCYKAMSEPGLLTGSGRRGVVVSSRGFQVMGKKPAPISGDACSGAGGETKIAVGTAAWSLELALPCGDASMHFTMKMPNASLRSSQHVPHVRPEHYVAAWRWRLHVRHVAMASRCVGGVLLCGAGGFLVCIHYIRTVG